MSQQQLADMLFVDRSSIANWENNRRIPDALTLTKIANVLGVDVSLLVGEVADSIAPPPPVIIVDDEQIILNGEIAVMKKLLPDVNVLGFSNPAEALDYVRNNEVNIAFLDIEMGNISGIDLCEKMMGIRNNINVIFLTAYVEYSFDAWSTGATGFIVKPITREALIKQLNTLRFPVRGLKIND